MAPVLRTAEPRDREALLELIVTLQEHERQIHDGLLPGAVIAEPYLAYLEYHVGANDGTLLVAEREGRVIGFVACLIDHYEGPEEAPDSAVYGLVSDIAVLPDYRGQGVAQFLLAAAEAHARACGMARLRIEALSANREALGAYRRFGFEPYMMTLEKKLALG